MRVRVAAGNVFNAQQWFGFSAADAAELLRVSEPETNVVTEPDQRATQAIVRLVQQWADLAAGNLEADCGRLSLQAALEESHPEQGRIAKLVCVGNGSVSIAARLDLDPDLLTALELREQAPCRTPPVPAAEWIQDLARRGNLELLMDVELGVMLQFGCRRATLREVLELTTGAVLELDREIQEPVDLLLNGRVIARGEVVVIDGNYGLRVTDVAPAQQRVNSL